VGASEAAAGPVLHGHGDQSLVGLAASAAPRRRVPPVDEALVKLDDAAQQHLAIAAPWPR